MTKIPVSESTVVQRINRKLHETGGRLKVNRWHSRAQRELGRYMVLNSCNAVEWHTDELGNIASEYGVLGEHEAIEEIE